MPVKYAPNKPPGRTARKKRKVKPNRVCYRAATIIIKDGVRYVSARSAATRLDVSRPTICAYCRDGVLLAVRDGRAWLIAEEALVGPVVPKRGRPARRYGE